MRRIVIVPTVLLAAAVLGACGSSGGTGGAYGGGSSKTTSTTAAAATSAGRYGGGSSKTTAAAAAATTGASSALTAKDFAFTPTALMLPAGGGTVKFTNNGSVQHSFTIEGQSVSKDVDAGTSASIAVNLPAGTYKFHCRFHPTQMKGTITVA